MKLEPGDRPPVSLKDAVVAVIEAGDPQGAALAASSAGWSVIRLAGARDASRLRSNQAGLTGALSAAAAAFGDELRIADELEGELRQGRVVLVLSGGDSSDGLSGLLKEHGARSVWEFGSWTFTRTADDDGGEAGL